MKHLRPAMLYASLIAIFALSAAGARACSCAPPPEVAEALEQADAVFWGEVTDQDPPEFGGSEPRRINVAVLRSWKGVTGTQVGITTWPSSSSSGFATSIGEQLIFYATQAEDGRLSFSLCARTGLREASLDDAAELDQLAEAIELVDGCDPRYPPFELEAAMGGLPCRAQSFRGGSLALPCGAGVAGATAFCLCGLVVRKPRQN